MTTSAFTHRPPRKWRRVVLALASPMTELAAALVTDFTGCGVELATDNAVEPPRDLIIGYLPEDATNEEERLATTVRSLHDRFPELPVPELRFEWLEEEDWGSTWKRYFTTIQLTPRLAIKPSWETGQPGDTEHVIELDPGLAFGTGHHASTKLALRLIDDLFAEGTGPSSVLDIGTGTGILAMASALFGAVMVLAVDNDPDAVATARDNIEINRLDETITVSDTVITTLTGPYNLVVANITSDVLLGLANSIVGLMAPGGHLVLSGILAGDQEKAVVAGYAALGLTPARRLQEDEWAALLLAKTNSGAIPDSDTQANGTTRSGQ